jgi:hypothetical protein
MMTLLAVIVTLRGAFARPASTWRRMGVFATLAFAVAVAMSVAMLIEARSDSPDAATAKRTFLFLRAVDLGNGVSPLVPILLLGGAGLLLVLCSLRRFNLLEECPLSSPFLNFGNGSFEGLSKLEDRIRYLLECRPGDLPGAPIILLAVTMVLATALWRGRPSYPIDGAWFDNTVRFAALFVYAAFTLVFLRFVSVWLAIRELLRRLYWHPTRGSYAALRKSLPGEQTEKKRINTLEPRPSYTAVEACLQNARRIVEDADFPFLRAAIDCAEGCLRRAYRLEDDSTSQWREVLKARLQTERTMSTVSGAVASIFDGEWRQWSVTSRPSRAKRKLGVRLTDEANLFVAARVVDFLRQVMPQLNSLAVFGTAGMLLMLLAISSYPFPQRDTLIWLSWATLLGAVLMLLVVFVQMNRDRIISLLHGTVPGKLSFDAALINQVVLFAVVPALSLLGAQFPETFRQFFSWASKIGSAH